MFQHGPLIGSNRGWCQTVPAGFTSEDLRIWCRVSRGISLDYPRENPGIHRAETPQENPASSRGQDTPPYVTSPLCHMLSCRGSAHHSHRSVFNCHH